MTLLNVIDSDKILTVNSIWENKFFESWAKVDAALVWKLWENQNWKQKTKKTKISNIMVPFFLYNKSYHFSNIIIIRVE